MRYRKHMMSRFFVGVFALFIMTVLSGRTIAGASRDEGVWAEANISDYSGSHACRICHKAHYKHWQSTIMSRFVRDRDAVPSPLPGNWNASPIRGSKDQVRVVIGMRKKVAFVTDNWRILPYQYHFKKKAWQRRDTWAKGDTDYRSRCGVCHLTGLNRDSREFVEMGVGCEVCHGPGARHVKTAKASDVLRVPSRDNAADLEFCGRCHNKRRDHDLAIKGYRGRFHPQSTRAD